MYWSRFLSESMHLFTYPLIHVHDFIISYITGTFCFRFNGLRSLVYDSVHSPPSRELIEQVQHFYIQTITISISNRTRLLYPTDHTILESHHVPRSRVLSDVSGCEGMHECAEPEIIKTKFRVCLDYGLGSINTRVYRVYVRFIYMCW